MRKISAPPPPTGIQSPDRPARIESLYRLRHPDPWDTGVKMTNGIPNLLYSLIFVAYIEFTYVAAWPNLAGRTLGMTVLCFPSETSSTLTFLNVLLGFR